MFHLLKTAIYLFTCLFKLGFTPCKARKPLQGMLKEKEAHNDYSIQEISLESTYSQ